MNVKDLIRKAVADAAQYGVETSTEQIMNMFYDANRDSWNSAVEECKKTMYENGRQSEGMMLIKLKKQ